MVVPLVQAARLHASGDLRLVDEPVPDVPDGHALVRVTAVGICGSDLHWFTTGSIGDAHIDRPLVLGHEIAGVVQGGTADGTRVAIDPAIPCRRCEVCRSGDTNLCSAIAFAGHGDLDGGLREYLAWPQDLLHPLPDSVSDADGAMLEPLGVALHALDLAHLRVGMHVVVAGAGPIGLLLVQLLKLAGAAHVTVIEPLAHRRHAALRMGAGAVFDPLDSDVEVARSDHGRIHGLDADVGFEVTDSPHGVQTVMEAVRPGSRVVLVGIPRDDRTTFRASIARRKGLTLVLSRRMKDTYPRAIRLVEAGEVDTTSLVTAAFDLRDASAAFELAALRHGIKVVIHPTAPNDTVGHDDPGRPDNLDSRRYER